jgi:hypothetical protein
MAKRKTVKNSVVFYELGSWPRLLGVTCSEAAFKREFEGCEGYDSWVTKGASASVHWDVPTNGKWPAAVVCFDLKKITNLNATVVHEATHVWQNIKEAMGEQSVSPEAEAYAVQYIFDTIKTSLKEARIHS